MTSTEKHEGYRSADEMAGRQREIPVSEFFLKNRALRWYLAALLVLCIGILVAAWHYPGGYDWFYTVATALASRKKNPAGGAWVAGALSLSMIMLWPCVSALAQRLRASATRATRLAIGALRVGLVCFALVGVEGLLIRDLTNWIYKGHEIVALAGFLGVYLGILGLLAQLVLRQRLYVVPALLIVSPLLAVGITQLWLYFEQRDLGWVDASWRVMGIPLWLSFAFWQWLAIAFLWAGMGLLALVVPRGRSA